MTKLMNILLFVYAAAAGFRVSLIGMLPLNEMMAVVLLPFFFWKDKEIIRRYPDARKVLVCFVLFGGLLVLSDIYNQSVPYDYLRGWANVFMLIVNFVFLLYLFDKSSEYSILFYIAGGLVSGYFGRRFVVLPGQAKYLALYVYPIVEPILLLGLVYLYKANRRLLVAALCIANGLFWMANDARSTGGGLVCRRLHIVGLSCRSKTSSIRQEGPCYIRLVGIGCLVHGVCDLYFCRD